jgi:hypothetical protein
MVQRAQRRKVQHARGYRRLTIRAQTSGSAQSKVSIMLAEPTAFIALSFAAYALGYATRAYVSHLYRRRYRFSLSRV